MRDQNNSCLTINFKMNQTKHSYFLINISKDINFFASSEIDFV